MNAGLTRSWGNVLVRRRCRISALGGRHQLCAQYSGTRERSQPWRGNRTGSSGSARLVAASLVAFVGPCAAEIVSAFDIDQFPSDGLEVDLDRFEYPIKFRSLFLRTA